MFCVFLKRRVVWVLERLNALMMPYFQSLLGWFYLTKRVFVYKLFAVNTKSDLIGYKNSLQKILPNLGKP